MFGVIFTLMGIVCATRADSMHPGNYSTNGLVLNRSININYNYMDEVSSSLMKKKSGWDDAWEFVFDQTLGVVQDVTAGRDVDWLDVGLSFGIQAISLFLSPVLGAAISFGIGLFSALFGSTSSLSHVLQDLVDEILETVEEMITVAIVGSQMSRNEENLLAQMRALEISYNSVTQENHLNDLRESLISINTAFATSLGSLAGDCYTYGTTDSRCFEWSKAGGYVTIAMSGQAHLQGLVDLDRLTCQLEGRHGYYMNQARHYAGDYHRFTNQMWSHYLDWRTDGGLQPPTLETNSDRHYVYYTFTAGKDLHTGTEVTPRIYCKYRKGGSDIPSNGASDCRRVDDGKWIYRPDAEKYINELLDIFSVYKLNEVYTPISESKYLVDYFASWDSMAHGCVRGSGSGRAFITSSYNTFETCRNFALQIGSTLFDYTSTAGSEACRVFDVGTALANANSGDRLFCDITDENTLCKPE